jgi:hypothetical protein
MKHVYEKTGQEFEIGRMFDFDGKTYDICIITKWDVEHDFEQNPVVIDFYFGEYDKDVTDYCISEYLKRQEGLKQGLKFLEGYHLISCVDGDFMDSEDKTQLENSIEVIKQMINHLV